MQELIEECIQQDPNGDAQMFYKLLEESEVPLYPECKKYSNLSFIVNLMHIKSTGNMSNKAFDQLLELLKNAFPMCEKLPTSNYGAKKIVKELGLHYERIDACKNDCVIYYKELGDASECPTCKLSRWKTQRTTIKKKGKKVKKIPWKVLRYFPLTPRLQRLFMSSKTAPDMRWHFEDRVKDGVLRHPADAEAWKTFDQIHPSFGNEHRNVRLGLATDGFNPFGNMSVSHSTWPVLLFPYNLPPWMCMKEPYIFLSLLIPGPKSPGNDIDVYLRPLIDELNTLWEYGAETYDISTKQNFQMRALIELSWSYVITNFPCVLPKKPCEALIELSYFFRELCAKVLRVSDLELLEKKIAITLCKLEMIFPPAFFDIMVHLSIHLAWEAKVCGPVQYRWMYPIERYLHKLNTYVRNKACPEGSIAEGYLAEECITFCSRYLCQVETKFNRVERNYDGGQPLQDKTQLSIFSLPGKTIGTGVLTVMTEELHHAATHYVLTNCDECLPFIEEHKDILRIQHGDDRVDELHKKNFVEWFSKKIQQLYVDGKVSAQMRSLAQSPGKQAVYYKGYNIHGFRFHTVQHDVTKKTQNSGVMVKGENQINCVPWYGTLTDVVELWYTDHNKVVLFHCNWFDTATKGKGYKEDRYGILSVNNKGKLNTQEPFVLASQATQVYYVEGIKNSAWSVVVETKPRNVFEMPTNEEEPYQEEESQTSHTYANRNEEEDNEE